MCRFCIASPGPNDSELSLIQRQKHISINALATPSSGNGLTTPNYRHSVTSQSSSPQASIASFLPTIYRQYTSIIPIKVVITKTSKSNHTILIIIFKSISVTSFTFVTSTLNYSSVSYLQYNIYAAYLQFLH